MNAGIRATQDEKELTSSSVQVPAASRSVRQCVLFVTQCFLDDTKRPQEAELNPYMFILTKEVKQPQHRKERRLPFGLPYSFFILSALYTLDYMIQLEAC